MTQRSDPKVKEQEAETKKQKRSSDPKVKEKETELKRQKRVDSNNFEKELESKRKYRADMKELLIIFNNSVADGPIYVCKFASKLGSNTQLFRHQR